MSIFRKTTLLTLFFSVLVLMSACSKTEEKSEGGGSTTGGTITGGTTDVTKVIDNLVVDLSTDKAFYKPGETITFTASTLPQGTTVRYRSRNNVMSEQSLTSSSWTWTAPSTDYTGYLVDLYTTESDGTEVILGTIGVDVSSDWTHFPRYGFVATFDDTKRVDGKIEEEIEFLNRYHINGVQFQDWHNKHHWPLGGTRDNLYDVYKDIANRDVYTSVVKKYIDVIHSYGMNTMFYNLCYGALSDAAEDGVQEEWYIFKNSGRVDKDSHDLPASWKSNIYLLDPSNTDWQAYIGERNDDVYANFDFDGYQIDQLGDRGDRYDYYSNKVNLPRGYASFIEAMKQKHPTKKLVMNSVSSYGASAIAGTGLVDFLYNEVWEDEGSFSDLQTIVKANDSYSGNTLKTVFAAYMNYDKANGGSGYFNTPGVLLTDAVIFALGGSHLELGDHMLCQEYFPQDALEMSDELKTSIVRYYDFLTAYENLLRDTNTSSEISALPSSSNVSINVWPPKKGAVSAYSKDVDGKQVIHLLNFVNADDLSWRDLNGTMPTPSTLSSIPLTLSESSKVKKIWVASPDFLAGASQELAFEQKDGVVTFELPNLKYWTMIVVEFDN